MKQRHKRYSAKITSASDQKKPLFAISPILLNIIAIVVFCGAYWYILRSNMFPDYQTYIYWTVNILISYNILVASARSFIAPIVTLIIAALILFSISNSSYLSVKEDWQLLGLGVAGLLISMSQLL